MNQTLSNIHLIMAVTIIFFCLGYIHYKSIIKRSEQLMDKWMTINKNLTQNKQK